MAVDGVYVFLAEGLVGEGSAGVDVQLPLPVVDAETVQAAGADGCGCGGVLLEIGGEAFLDVRLDVLCKERDAV